MEKVCCKSICLTAALKKTLREVASSSNFINSERQPSMSLGYRWHSCLADSWRSPGSKGLVTCEEPGSRADPSGGEPTLSPPIQPSHPAPEWPALTFSFSSLTALKCSRPRETAVQHRHPSLLRGRHPTGPESANHLPSRSRMMRRPGFTWAARLLSHAVGTNKTSLGACEFFQHCAATWITIQLPLRSSNRDWDLQDKVRRSATFNYL